MIFTTLTFTEKTHLAARHVNNQFNKVFICKWSQMVQVYAVAAARYSPSMQAGATA